MSQNARGVIKHCEHCGSIISEREIALSKEMVSSLWKVFKWCKEKGIHEFQTKEVKHLWNHTQYATFGDWVYFGGLVYKKKKANYGLNIERVEAFLKNEYTIPIRVWKNPVTKEVTPEERHYAQEIPSLMKMLNEDGYYQVNYRVPPAPSSLFQS